MKPWQWALIGVGVVAGVVVIAKVVSAPPASSETVLPPTATAGGTGYGNTGDPAANAVSGAFGLAGTLSHDLIGFFQNRETLAAAERDRTGKGAGTSDPNYDPTAALAVKTGGRSS